MPGQLPPLGGDLRFIRNWKLDECLAAMRTGINSGGHALGEQTPWRVIGRMSDDDFARALRNLVDLPKA